MPSLLLRDSIHLRRSDSRRVSATSVLRRKRRVPGPSLIPASVAAMLQRGTVVPARHAGKEGDSLLGKHQAHNGWLEGGRSPLLESTQRATLLSLATATFQRQCNSLAGNGTLQRRYSYCTRIGAKCRGPGLCRRHCGVPDYRKLPECGFVRSGSMPVNVAVEKMSYRKNPVKSGRLRFRFPEIS